MKRRTTLGLLILLVALLAGGFYLHASAAAPLYVRPGGSDTGCDGTVNEDAPGTVVGKCAFTTIQHAINLVDVGGVVYVAAGVYPGSLLVDKPVSLVGPQAGVAVSGRTAGSGAEAVLDASGRPQALTIKGSHVLVDGFDIQGDANTYAGVLITPTSGSGDLTGITVRNNFIHGMKLPNPSSSTYVTSYGVFSIGEPVAGARRTLSEVNITANEIYNLGGVVSGADTSAGAGVWLYSLKGAAPGAGVTISSNFFHDIANGYDASSSDVEYGSGIVLVDDGDPNLDSGAFVSGNRYMNTFSAAVLFIANTSFADEAANMGTANLLVLNAGNLATVDEAALARYAKTDLPTGWPSSTGYFASVKTAIEQSDAGATVNVSAGAFNEGPQVVLARNVTIRGAGPGLTTLRPTANTGSSGDSRGWFLVNGGVTFTLSELRLDGSGFQVNQGVRVNGSGVIEQVSFTEIKYPGYLGIGVAAFGQLQVSNCSFSQIGRIGTIYFGSGTAGSTFTNNTYTGKGPGDWLDYGVEISGGGSVTISGSSISNNRGVASSDGSTSAAILATTYYGAGSNATLTANTLTNNTTAIAVGYDASDSSTVSGVNNCLSSNDYGATNTSLLTNINLTNNYWGDASGPYHPATNPLGLGDEAEDNISYAPWLNSCSGSPVYGNIYNETDNAYFSTLQAAVDNPNTGTGDVIRPLIPGPIPGLTTIPAGKPGLTFDLTGATLTGGSPAFEIYADDTTLLNGVLDGWTGGANNASPAIIVHGGADNFILFNSEIQRWSNGVQLLDDVVSFKIVGNWFHDNTGAGLLVESGTTLQGIVTIEGNLFKENGGAGIENNGSGWFIDGSLYPLPAGYNSWGDTGGPSSGDGVVGNVITDNFTYLEMYLDMLPDTNATAVTVSEATNFIVKIKADAVRLYGLAFKISYDSTMLTLNNVAFSAPWAGKCTSIPGGPIAGEIAYFCYQAYPDGEWTTTSGDIAAFEFTAGGPGLSGNGPWDTYLDISHLVEDTSSAAIGGQKIWVNNAGYGASSTTARDLTDSDDGQVQISGVANYRGYVDLQGNLNDGGAVLDVYDQSLKTGASHLASGTSASSGLYTTSHLSPYLLTLGSDYWLVIDAPRYLPTTAITASQLNHTKTLTNRPYTDLAKVVLLGGDAVDDNVIDILDAGLIGGAFGSTVSCGVSSCADVNGDGIVNIQDLTLMSGNYTLRYSPWIP